MVATQIIMFTPETNVTLYAGYTSKKKHKTKTKTEKLDWKDAEVKLKTVRELLQWSKQ